MLYFLYQYEEWFGPFRLFGNLPFRVVGAACTALLISLIFGPWSIRMLIRLKLGQPLRTKEEVHQLADLHGEKQGTPTMGGLLVVSAVFLSCVLWANPINAYIWLVLLALTWMAFIGFWDDYLKVSKKNSDGVSGKMKLGAQLLLSIIVTAYLYLNPATQSQAGFFHLPFIKEPLFQMGFILAALFFVLVITGTSNAVNLTDGLDGLAIGCTCSVFVVYLVFCYVVGDKSTADYLQLTYVPGVREVAIFCGAMVGAGLGFLWYNCHPAKVFMGDTGSLSIGGALGTVSIIVHQEILLVLAGGVFVMEAGSVLLQVLSFKLTKKRLFAMSPLHHHFELKGWNESTVTIRFWILGILFALLALSTLKLR